MTASAPAAPAPAHATAAVDNSIEADDVAADAHLLVQEFHHEERVVARPAALRVVVADDHHHVLPEIHLAIRKRALPFTGIRVLHFDAHPDLSFPRTLDPALVFEPQVLYDALDDSVSGIAEFLLPLVYAGHVSQITWIKPHWAQQMPVRAMVGAFVGKCISTGALSVSLPLAHFIDEDSFAPASEMDEATRKQWDLFVAELPPTDTLERGSVLHEAVSQLLESRDAYVLDIDLDYFSTWNPFRKDLEQRLGSSATELVQRVFGTVAYKDMTNSMVASARMRDRRAFADALEQIRRDELFLDRASTPSRAILSTALPVLYCRAGSSSSSDDTAALDAAQHLLASFFDLLAELDSDARELVWWAGPNMDLPHHESSRDDIERMVQSFSAFLIASGCSALRRPALVTIAKSTGDEYLPPHQLALVQALVLQALTDVFGELATEFIEYERVNDNADDVSSAVSSKDLE